MSKREPIVFCLLFTILIASAMSVYYIYPIAEAFESGTLNVSSPAYPTIQAAIDKACDGDTVLVEDGIYTGQGNKNLDFGGKAITVQSQNGPANCIIDCEGDGRGAYFHSGEGQDSEFSGFSITRGHAVGWGGAIHCTNSSSPTITNCIITDNHSDYAGGGINCTSSSAPVIIDCIIRGNTAQLGAGLSLGGNSSPTIVNCTIADNMAEHYGGGMYCGTSTPSIINCTITQNQSNPAYDCSGAGIVCEGSSSTITNCILWANDPDELYLSISSSNPTVTYSNVGLCSKTVFPGEGNIYADPLFYDPTNGDFRLCQGSPCIDVGNNDAVPAWLMEDFQGESRIINDPLVVDTNNGTPAIVDIGADERNPGTGPIDPIPELPTLALFSLGLVGIAGYAGLRRATL